MGERGKSADSGSVQPELVFGLVGPVGVDMDAVQSCLCAALSQVGYKSHLIHLTKLMKPLEAAGRKRSRHNTIIDEKISRANALCEQFKDNRVLAALAISEIRRIRKTVNLETQLYQDEATAADFEAPGNAYVIRQLKRDDEIDLLRWVYRRNFLQISVALDRDLRIASQKNRLSRENPRLSPLQCDRESRRLIEKDEAEEDNPFGQRVRSIFPLGDVFISGKSPDAIAKNYKSLRSSFLWEEQHQSHAG